MNIELKELINLPKKRIIITSEGISYEEILNRGFNQAIDEIGEMEVEVNEHEIENIMQKETQNYEAVICMDYPGLRFDFGKLRKVYSQSIAKALPQILKKGAGDEV